MKKIKIIFRKEFFIKFSPNESKAYLFRDEHENKKKLFKNENIICGKSTYLF